MNTSTFRNHQKSRLKPRPNLQFSLVSPSSSALWGHAAWHEGLAAFSSGFNPKKLDNACQVKGWSSFRSRLEWHGKWTIFKPPSVCIWWKVQATFQTRSARRSPLYSTPEAGQTLCASPNFTKLAILPHNKPKDPSADGKLYERQWDLLHLGRQLSTAGHCLNTVEDICMFDIVQYCLTLFNIVYNCVYATYWHGLASLAPISSQLLPKQVWTIDQRGNLASSHFFSGQRAMSM